MTLQAPGGSPPTNPISFSQIAVEFGHLNHTLGNYRRVQSIPNSGLDNLPLDEGIPTSGTISFSDFYSKRLNIVVDCFTGGEETTTNAKTEKWDNNLITVIGNFGKSKKEVGSKIIVAVNKTFKSDDINPTPQKCALRTGTWNPNAQIVVEVAGNGKIYGAGGKGGKGANRVNNTGGSGGEGGGALGIQANGTVVNVRTGGLILAGGGVGGGGGGQRETSGLWSDRRASGGGGGGGAGFPPGPAGERGTLGTVGKDGNAGNAITGIGAYASGGTYGGGGNAYYRKIASTTPGRTNEGGNNDAFFDVIVVNGGISYVGVATKFTTVSGQLRKRGPKFGGQKYAVGQTVIINGSDLGGSTDVSFNITSIGGGFGGLGGNNGNQALGGIGGTGGNFGASGNRGLNGNEFDPYGNNGQTNGGAGGAVGGAIRRTAGISFTIGTNNGTISGSTNQTGVSA